MISFFISHPKHINGGVNRYKDFFNFLKNHNKKYVVNDVNFMNYENNIIDHDYLMFETNGKDPKGRTFIGGARQIFEILSHNKEIYIHNLEYARLLYGYFFPMFMKENIYKINEKIKYKYGIFYSTYDANSTIIDYFLKPFNIDPKDVLLLDREDTMRLSKYDTTQNTEYFLNSVNSIIEFSSKYATRHVFSRFFGECVLREKPIYYISDDDSIPNTILRFKHIQIKDIVKKNNIHFNKILYNKKYFLTETYSDYIFHLLDNHEKIYFEYVEDYANDKI